MKMDASVQGQAPLTPSLFRPDNVAPLLIRWCVPPPPAPRSRPAAPRCPLSAVLPLNASTSQPSTHPFHFLRTPHICSPTIHLWLTHIPLPTHTHTHTHTHIHTHPRYLDRTNLQLHMYFTEPVIFVNGATMVLVVAGA